MLKTLLKSVREYKIHSLLSPLFVTLEVIMECILPLLTSKLLKSMDTNDVKTMIIMIVLLIVVASFGLLFGFLSGKFGAIAAAGFAKNLRKDLYYKVQEFSFENIDKFSASSLVTRMTTDINNIQMAYGMIIRPAVRSPLMLIFSLIMSYMFSWKVATATLIAVPFMLAFFIIVFMLVRPVFQKVFKKYDAFNETIQENINGIRVVKSYVREDFEKEKFNVASGNIKKDFTKAEAIISFTNPVMGFFMNITLIVICIFGAYIITSSGGTEIKVTDMQALLVYNVQVLNAILFLNFIFVMVSMSQTAAKRVVEVLEEKPSLTNCENPVYEVKDGSIEFKNVSFKYSAKAERNALENISISIKSGMTVGVIGGTGSAKTTFVNLISRLYDVSEGELLVGGVNVKDYDLKTLRDEVSVVLQKNVLFSGTIAENLRWGNENATDEEIKHACHLSCADEFVEAFPDKYDHKIEQGGTNVSGGQKQRLCIARALLKQPKILVLDDSTSAVDTKTDAIIRKGFKDEIPNTTKIIIAQRVSSVEASDMIIVLDGGHINGVGTHDELIKNNAIYQEVYSIQTKGDEE